MLGHAGVGWAPVRNEQTVRRRETAPFCRSGLASLATILATILAAGACWGCADASSQSRFELVEETVSIVRTLPEAGAGDIRSDVQIDLCWSDLLDPLSIGDLDGSISSGRRVFDSDLEIQLFAWRGPQGEDLPASTEAAWCSGSVLSITPVEPLQAGARHRLRLWADPVGWSGESIDLGGAGWTTTPEGRDVFYLEFEVAAEADAPPPRGEPEPTPTLSELFSAGRVFDPKRGLCSCHLEEGEAANALLDLSTPALAHTDLVSASRVRETGFTMVTPRRPSESFLIHKLLRDQDGSAIDGVLGHPMPKGEGPLPYRDLVDIARWIEGGARP